MSTSLFPPGDPPCVSTPGDFFPHRCKKETQRTTNAAEVLVTRSNLYREFLAEREEILKHKWIESEKTGHDIGFDRALLDWVRNHRTSWRKQRRSPTKRCQ